MVGGVEDAKWRIELKPKAQFPYKISFLSRAWISRLLTDCRHSPHLGPFVLFACRKEKRPANVERGANCQCLIYKKHIASLAGECNFLSIEITLKALTRQWFMFDLKMMMTTTKMNPPFLALWVTSPNRRGGERNASKGRAWQRKLERQSGLCPPSLRFVWESRGNLMRYSVLCRSTAPHEFDWHVFRESSRRKLGETRYNSGLSRRF